MEAEDYLRENITPEKYPVIVRLYEGGTAELYEYAAEKGFIPKKEGYPTRCAFCYAMRAYLASLEQPTAGLAPLCFYRDMRLT